MRRHHFSSPLKRTWDTFAITKDEVERLHQRIDEADKEFKNKSSLFLQKISDVERELYSIEDSLNDTTNQDLAIQDFFDNREVYIERILRKSDDIMSRLLMESKKLYGSIDSKVEEIANWYIEYVSESKKMIGGFHEQMGSWISSSENSLSSPVNVELIEEEGYFVFYKRTIGFDDEIIYEIDKAYTNRRPLVKHSLVYPSFEGEIRAPVRILYFLHKDTYVEIHLSDDVVVREFKLNSDTIGFEPISVESHPIVDGTTGNLYRVLYAEGHYKNGESLGSVVILDNEANYNRESISIPHPIKDSFILTNKDEYVFSLYGDKTTTSIIIPVGIAGVSVTDLIRGDNLYRSENIGDWNKFDKPICLGDEKIIRVLGWVREDINPRILSFNKTTNLIESEVLDFENLFMIPIELQTGLNNTPTSLSYYINRDRVMVNKFIDYFSLDLSRFIFGDRFYIHSDKIINVIGGETHYIWELDGPKNAIVKIEHEDSDRLLHNTRGNLYTNEVELINVNPYMNPSFVENNDVHLKNILLPDGKYYVENGAIRSILDGRLISTHPVLLTKPKLLRLHGDVVIWDSAIIQNGIVVEELPNVSVQTNNDSFSMKNRERFYHAADGSLSLHFSKFYNTGINVIKHKQYGPSDDKIKEIFDYPTMFDKFNLNQFGLTKKENNEDIENIWLLSDVIINDCYDIVVSYKPFDEDKHGKRDIFIRWKYIFSMDDVEDRFEPSILLDTNWLGNIRYIPESNHIDSKGDLFLFFFDTDHSERKDYILSHLVIQDFRRNGDLMRYVESSNRLNRDPFDITLPNVIAGLREISIEDLDESKPYEYYLMTSGVAVSSVAWDNNFVYFLTPTVDDEFSWFLNVSPRTTHVFGSHHNSGGEWYEIRRFNTIHNFYVNYRFLEQSGSMRIGKELFYGIFNEQENQFIVVVYDTDTNTNRIAEIFTMDENQKVFGYSFYVAECEDEYDCLFLDIFSDVMDDNDELVTGFVCDKMVAKFDHARVSYFTLLEEKTEISFDGDANPRRAGFGNSSSPAKVYNFHGNQEFEIPIGDCCDDENVVVQFHGDNITFIGFNEEYIKRPYLTIENNNVTAYPVPSPSGNQTVVIVSGSGEIYYYDIYNQEFVNILSYNDVSDGDLENLFVVYDDANKSYAIGYDILGDVSKIKVFYFSGSLFVKESLHRLDKDEGIVGLNKDNLITLRRGNINFIDEKDIHSSRWATLFTNDEKDHDVVRMATYQEGRTAVVKTFDRGNVVEKNLVYNEHAGSIFMMNSAKQPIMRPAVQYPYVFSFPKIFYAYDPHEIKALMVKGNQQMRVDFRGTHTIGDVDKITRSITLPDFAMGDGSINIIRRQRILWVESVDNFKVVALTVDVEDNGSVSSESIRLLILDENNSIINEYEIPSSSSDPILCELQIRSLNDIYVFPYTQSGNTNSPFDPMGGEDVNVLNMYRIVNGSTLNYNLPNVSYTTSIPFKTFIIDENRFLAFGQVVKISGLDITFENINEFDFVSHVANGVDLYSRQDIIDNINYSKPSWWGEIEEIKVNLVYARDVWFSARMISGEIITILGRVRNTSTKTVDIIRRFHIRPNFLFGSAWFDSEDSGQLFVHSSTYEIPSSVVEVIKGTEPSIGVGGEILYSNLHMDRIQKKMFLIESGTRIKVYDLDSVARLVDLSESISDVYLDIGDKGGRTLLAKQILGVERDGERTISLVQKIKSSNRERVIENSFDGVSLGVVADPFSESYRTDHLQPSAFEVIKNNDIMLLKSLRPNTSEFESVNTVIDAININSRRTIEMPFTVISTKDGFQRVPAGSTFFRSSACRIANHSGGLENNKIHFRLVYFSDQNGYIGDVQFNQEGLFSETRDLIFAPDAIQFASFGGDSRAVPHTLKMNIYSADENAPDNPNFIKSMALDISPLSRLHGYRTNKSLNKVLLQDVHEFMMNVEGDDDNVLFFPSSMTGDYLPNIGWFLYVGVQRRGDITVSAYGDAVYGLNPYQS